MKDTALSFSLLICTMIKAPFSCNIQEFYLKLEVMFLKWVQKLHIPHRAVVRIGESIYAKYLKQYTSHSENYVSVSPSPPPSPLPPFFFLLLPIHLPLPLPSSSSSPSSSPSSSSSSSSSSPLLLLLPLFSSFYSSFFLLLLLLLFFFLPTTFLASLNFYLILSTQLQWFLIIINYYSKLGQFVLLLVS